MTPRVRDVRQDDTHRLIPTRYSDRSVLERLSENQRQLENLFELEGATNDRLLERRTCCRVSECTSCCLAFRTRAL